MKKAQVEEIDRVDVKAVRLCEERRQPAFRLILVVRATHLFDASFSAICDDHGGEFPAFDTACVEALGEGFQGGRAMGVVSVYHGCWLRGMGGACFL